MPSLPESIEQTNAEQGRDGRAEDPIGQSAHSHKAERSRQVIPKLNHQLESTTAPEVQIGSRGEPKRSRQTSLEPVAEESELLQAGSLGKFWRAAWPKLATPPPHHPRRSDSHNESIITLERVYLEADMKFSMQKALRQIV